MQNGKRLHKVQRIRFRREPKQKTISFYGSSRLCRKKQPQF